MIDAFTPVSQRGGRGATGESILMKTSCAFSLLMLLGWSLSGPARAADSCQAQDVAVAYRAGNGAELALLLKARECGGVAYQCTGQLLGLTLLAEADRLEGAGQTQEARRLFEQATHLPKSWQIHRQRGDLAFADARGGDHKSYAEAADAYEKAVNDIAAPFACAPFGAPAPPGVAVIAALYKRMTEAKLLAPTFDVAATRDGECGGVFLPKIRGFEPKAVQLPIEFESNSTTLTAKGEQAADGLTRCAHGMASLSLSGHADEHGSDAYNMGLSARRLEAIKTRLVQSGFQGAITIEPKGKREPFAVDDPGRYSHDEIDQMNRRVELRGVKR